MIQGAKKDKKPLAILNYCASTCSGAGKLCVQDVDIASIEERKTFFSAAAQIRFMTKFSQSWEIPFWADKLALSKKYLMMYLIEQIHMTSTLKRWQLNLRKTDASVRTERTSSLIFEKEKKIRKYFFEQN